MPRLLLVEDAPDVALLAERLARRLGLDVAHRTDVASAWEDVRRSAPDLILLDLNLPGERGEELCRRVRSETATAHIPVALFVPWGCPGDVVSGLEAGADHVVAKDLLARPEEWQARLREILAGDDGLGPPATVHCHWNNLHPLHRVAGLEALNRALRHPLLRLLGSDLVRFVLGRAVGRAGGKGPWLEADGLALDVRHVATTASGEAVAALVFGLTEQLQRLLGTEASAPARAALTAALDPPRE
jgi:DNA-binding response OmpR family regulator